jgi:hypothetical protein
LKGKAAREKGRGVLSFFSQLSFHLFLSKVKLEKPSSKEVFFFFSFLSQSFLSQVCM